MSTLKVNLVVAVLVLLVFSCEKRICGCVFPPSPVAGNWQLVRITYGLTQKTVTAAQAGYSETLSFDGLYTGGNYRRVRNGLPLENGVYSFANSANKADGLLLFQSDTTQQSFRLVENHLFLSDRIAQGATLADGSTYEYQRE
jgi:hypothetical protein